MKFFLSVITVLCLLAGCQLVGPDEPVLSIETDRQQYTIGEQISVTVSNGVRSAYLNACYGPFIGLDETNADGVWTEVRPATGPCPAFLDWSPMLLEPAYVFRVRLTIDEAGTYRLRIPFGRSRFDDFTETALSNEFTVVIH